ASALSACQCWRNGAFDRLETGRNCRTWVVSLRKSTQDAPKSVYAFIPDLPLKREWTDAALYTRYGLTPNEIAFIESQVAEHDDELFDQNTTDYVDDE
ncbi:MAG: hypothetical protein ACK57J_06705, partial [Rubrivivax sp.]